MGHLGKSVYRSHKSNNSADQISARSGSQPGACLAATFSPLRQPPPPKQGFEVICAQLSDTSGTLLLENRRKLAAARFLENQVTVLQCSLFLKNSKRGGGGKCKQRRHRRLQKHPLDVLAKFQSSLPSISPNPETSTLY